MKYRKKGQNTKVLFEFTYIVNLDNLPILHIVVSSSLPFPQSSSPSHRSRLAIHRPFVQLNVSDGQIPYQKSTLHGFFNLNQIFGE